MTDVSVINSDMKVLHSQVKIINDLLGGTKAMRNAKKSYLFQMELETDKAYEARLNRSTLYPALYETLSQMCGRVFFKPITIDDINEKIKNDILPDVDMVGNNLDVFASQWFYSALAYGVSFVLVDYTKTANTRTLAEEKSQGARPYFVHIKPQAVLGFKSAMINGKQSLTQFRYKELIVEDDGEFGLKTIEQINVYEIGRVRKYQNLESGWELVEDLEMKAKGKALDFVPIVPFITKPCGFMLGEPPLMELAYLNIKHWQSQSDQDNILNIARVPLLGIFSDNDVQNLTIGGSAIQLNTESRMAYIEHSGSSINAGQDSLKELESQMRVAGAKLLDKTVLAMTDSQARDEQGKEISLLRLYANKFEDSLDLALEYVGKWMGIENVGNVEISGNIDSDLDPNASMDTVIKLQMAGTLSKHSVFNEAKRRGLIGDTLEWEDEQARLDEEGMSNEFITGDNA